MHLDAGDSIAFLHVSFPPDVRRVAVCLEEETEA